MYSYNRSYVKGGVGVVRHADTQYIYNTPYPKSMCTEKMDKIKQLYKQIDKERKELKDLDGMDWFIKAAHIHGLYQSIIIHSISQPNSNLLGKPKTL